MRLKDKWEDDSNQYRRYNLKQKINSVIFGLAIGDALGVPVEFRNRDTYHIQIWWVMEPIINQLVPGQMILLYP